MVATIRQSVTVQEGGVVEVRSPELQAGERAEVIILIDGATGPRSRAALAALDALLAKPKLTPGSASAWARQACEERDSFGPRAWFSSIRTS